MRARLFLGFMVAVVFAIVVAGNVLCIGPQDTLRTDTGEIIPTPDPGDCGVDYADSQFIASLRPGYLTLPSGETEAALDSCSVDSSLKALLEDHYVEYVEQVFTGAELYDTLRIIGSDTVTVPDLSQIYLLHQDTTCDVLDAVEDMYSHDATRFAEPNGFGELLDVPNDEYWDDQWNLKDDNYGIGCPTAWDVTYGDYTVRLGIIDTGINYEHEDLGGPDYPNQKIAGGYDYGNNDSDPMDESNDSHGTKVAGIAGALTNNEIGIAGISGGWDRFGADTGVKIYAFRESGGGVGAKAEAMWAATDPDSGYLCNIVNCSWRAGNPEAIMPSILFAYQNRANVVAGKSNDYNFPRVYYPAECPYRNWVIGVAGYGLDGKFCDDDAYCGYHSDEGFGIDLVAPAWEIPSTDLAGEISDFEGNSAAVPHVSGAVALLRTINNDLLPEDYEGMLRFSADDPGPRESDGNVWSWHYRYGHGRLDVAAAVTKLDPNSDWALYSHTATGGVSAGLSDIYLCKFEEGELDGYYDVQRCSVVVSVSYPETFNEIPYVWGLGEGTVGWSGCSPNYQVGWCQLVPNSQGIDRCRLFGYVYKVYGANPGQMWTWYPVAPGDVELHYRLWGVPSSGPPKLSMEELPLEFSFKGNYPDPFNSSTNLSYKLSQAAVVNISIYDILGRRVALLCDRYQPAGEYTHRWDAGDLPSGVYFARIAAGDQKRHERMVFLK